MYLLFGLIVMVASVSVKKYNWIGVINLEWLSFFGRSEDVPQICLFYGVSRLNIENGWGIFLQSVDCLGDKKVQTGGCKQAE